MKDSFLNCYDKNKLLFNCNSINKVFWFQKGDRNLENVTHEEAVATLKATHESVILVVGKPEPTGYVPAPPLPPDLSTSPQPCMYFYQFSFMSNIIA